MNFDENNVPEGFGSEMDLYARAAATLYGIISFDEFFKILEAYYGKGTLSKDRVMAYFWTSENNDPAYYVQDELIIHTSIEPDEIKSTLKYIRKKAEKNKLKNYKVLDQKEFLMYANPFYFEKTDGVKKMASYLNSTLGIPMEDVGEIVAEMVFICRTGSVPTLIMDALSRRDLPYGKECETDLITYGCEMEPEIRNWELLGFTGREARN